ncbi:hypothetical protein AERO8C_70029 [Aeromonas veronii]|uniref:Uncharacterized protein n=1 Tax=Aeromonas veronii TaxID=654 RepID=A0A653LBZ5_AERVE|nr:hypothetical protein AERO8C_70029 [Aeromonas veronii]
MRDPARASTSRPSCSTRLWQNIGFSELTGILVRFLHQSGNDLIVMAVIGGIRSYNRRHYDDSEGFDGKVAGGRIRAALFLSGVGRFGASGYPTQARYGTAAQLVQRGLYEPGAGQLRQPLYQCRAAPDGDLARLSGLSLGLCRAVSEHALRPSFPPAHLSLLTRP